MSPKEETQAALVGGVEGQRGERSVKWRTHAALRATEAYHGGFMTLYDENRLLASFVDDGIFLKHNLESMPECICSCNI